MHTKVEVRVAHLGWMHLPVTWGLVAWRGGCIHLLVRLWHEVGDALVIYAHQGRS